MRSPLFPLFFASARWTPSIVGLDKHSTPTPFHPTPTPPYISPYLGPYVDHYLGAYLDPTHIDGRALVFL